MFTLPAWVRSVAEFLAPLLTALLSPVLSALRTKRQDLERDDATRKAATATAEAETTDVIAEIADARSQVPTGGSARDVAKRLRERIRSEDGSRSDP